MYCNTAFECIFYRCPKDKDVRFLPSTNLEKRFNFRAFAFKINKTIVFIHCKVFLCRTQSKDQRCDSGCFSNSTVVNRKRRETETEPQMSKEHYITFGPFKETKADASSNDNNQGKCFILLLTQLYPES